MKESQTELSEDMEVIGPGQMLADARNALNLTQKDVAIRLNFTVTLVINIENEQFDSKLPATFTRGYLKSYARLVNVAEEDVLASYDLLGVAATQQAEMQSFSRITEKQAENNRLMWISYFIVALLIASTVVWWVQEQESESGPTTTQTTSTARLSNIDDKKPIPEAKQSLSKREELTLNEPKNNINNQVTANKKLTTTATSNVEKPLVITREKNTDTQEQQLATSTVIFKFSGDCWVNIYDATGERVAWGIKKAGYVMKISGKAPFNITLGKPELVAITFNGTPVDMSKFGAGNIAKFTLPITS